MNNKLKCSVHEADFCVVGGGLAGMCAATAAARHGLKTVIMHDRPVFGGNASSEIRMWVCGAHGRDNRETGIIEEICLENYYRNPYRLYPIWDTILFEKIKQEKNITVLLNCSCNDVEMNGNKIKSIDGWQTTTQKWHTVKAKYFADCSGDSILAPLCGAKFRMGREGSAEFNESIAPNQSDKKTMGMSCLIQARQTNEKRSFIAPKWAYKYTKADLPYRVPNLNFDHENFWYMEIGGENNSIEDTEEIRDELIKVAVGIWDFVKNSGECDADNWELDFLGFLPGKRESRRYVGDYIMDQNDVTSEGKFDDIIAYGGWSMDDHNPAGINTKEQPTIYHPAPSPFGIPYRSVYSKNIDNLFFAGRNISVTHSAMSSTRVMATCAILGQAVGTAAFIGAKYGLSPREIYNSKINELKNTLMDDDCYLPFNRVLISDITKKAVVTAKCQNPEKLLNGSERNIEDNGISIDINSEVVFEFNKPAEIKEVRIVLDSDLNRETIGGGNYLPQKINLCNTPIDIQPVNVPKTLVKDIKAEFLDDSGKWQSLFEITDNHQRLIKKSVCCTSKAIRIVPISTWGNSKANIFSIEFK